MVIKRAEAEEWGDEILGPALSWLDDTEQYDLVEVGTEPVSYGERRPN